jgi:hypothetical protein
VSGMGASLGVLVGDDPETLSYILGRLQASMSNGATAGAAIAAGSGGKADA